MNTRDTRTTTRTNVAEFQAPALVPIGGVENVVLGLPVPGDEYLGFTPPRFEFEKDDDAGGTAGGKARGK